ncbi:MAG TPA: type II secretion system F family protein [Phycisphaerales bacterium]|nr:type II secretion system F family protein [Phycisphaerales bacterium]
MTQVAYQYRAIDRRGASSRGVVRAVDQREAYRQILASGLKPVEIHASRSSGWLRLGKSNRVSLKDISHFTYQFSVLMQAKIPIVDGLESIAEQESNPKLREIIEDVSHSVAAGSSLTESISPHRHIFGEVYIETVRAAEKSGNMIEVLGRLSEILERQYEVNKQVKSALMYPMCVIGTLVLAVAFLMIAVVPKFAEMFANRGLDLPVPTQIIVGISGILRMYWYVFIGGAVIGIVLGKRMWNHPAWRGRIDGWLHRVPILGDILRGMAISRFAQVFGISLRSGITLMDALEMSGNASGRPLLRADTAKMREQVNQGGRLSDVLITCNYIPAFTRRMLAAGEEAAEMSRMCEVVSRHYDREVSHLTKNVTTLIEPIMVVGLAAVVLLIALAIFLPMWNMAALIG